MYGSDRSGWFSTTRTYFTQHDYDALLGRPKRTWQGWTETALTLAAAAFLVAVFILWWKS